MHERDRAIILSVGRFGQLSTANIRVLHFSTNASQTPVKTSLQRVVRSGYLARIERRMIGGTGAGSGQYVYQLGPKGWLLCQREGRYFPMRAVNYHTLAVADTFCSLVVAHQEGRLSIERYDVEDDAHRNVAGVKLTPDLFIRVARLSKPTLSLWIEVDLGTERQRQIAEKLDRYRHAYDHATTAHLDVFPPILFLVPDAHRAEQIGDTIRRQPADAQALFRVATSDDFPTILL